MTPKLTMSSSDIFWSLLDLYFDRNQYEEQEYRAKYPLLAHLNLYHSIKWGNYKGLALMLYKYANQEQKKYVEAFEANVQGLYLDPDLDEIEYLNKCYRELEAYYKRERRS